jgi:hypothetical protein
MWHDDGMVARLDGGMPEVEDLLLDTVDGGRVNPHRWQDRAAIPFGNPDDHVATSEVVKVVGEG